MKKIILIFITVFVFLTGCASSGKGVMDKEISVGAFYYPWYGVERGAHTTLDQSFRSYLEPAHRPALGEYDSRDTAVIAQHIEWSVQGGIDFWVSSWWGPGGGEDITLKDHILPHPDGGKIKHAILYETAGRLGSFENPDFTNLFSDMDYLRTHYFNHPHYLKIDGRPVIYIYLTREYFKGERVEQLRLLKKENPDLYIIGDDLFVVNNTAAKSGLLDAVAPYDVYGQSFAAGKNGSTRYEMWKLKQIYRNAYRQGEQRGFDFIPVVAPGYVDTGVRPEVNHSPAPRYFNKDKKSSFGDVFSELIKEVAFPTLDADTGNMMLITSFNEWHEDSQIEPTAGRAATTSVDVSESGVQYGGGYLYEDYGTRYLEILADLTGNR